MNATTTTTTTPPSRNLTARQNPRESQSQKAMTEIDPQVVQKYKKYAAELLLDPDDPAALIDQMALLINNGQRANAPNHICLARRAWRTAPDNVALTYNLARALEHIGNWQEALELYQRCAGETDPEFVFPLLNISALVIATPAATRKRSRLTKKRSRSSPMTSPAKKTSRSR